LHKFIKLEDIIYTVYHLEFSTWKICTKLWCLINKWYIQILQVLWREKFMLQGNT